MNGIRFKLIGLIMLANLTICPYWLDVSKMPKAILCSFLCFTFFLHCRFISLKNTILDLVIYSFIFLLFIATFLSSIDLGFTFAYVFVAAILFFWLLAKSFFSCENYSQITDFFLRLLAIFIFVIALLGLYEFFSFMYLGKSGKMLIPYILPPNKSVRVAGIFGQPNLFALLLLSGLLTFFYTYLHDPVFNLSNCRFKHLYYLPVFVVALCFFLTGSRAGLLAMLCTLLLMCLMVARKRYLAFDPEQRRKFCIMLMVVCIAWGTSYLLNASGAGSGTRSMAGTEISTQGRFVFWASAWLMFLDHPWFGIGLGNYKFYLSEYLSRAHEWLGFVQYEAMGYTKWAHNELLQLTCEGGIFVLLVLLALLGIFARQLFRFAQGGCECSPLKFYAHIFIIPFIIQSMFSWPLRHPGLLALFFTFMAMLGAQYTGKVVAVPKWGRYALKALALVALAGVIFIAVQETKMGLFARSMTCENARENFDRFEQLIAQPYTEYPLLLHLTPLYTSVALKEKDVEFGANILPYLKKLASMQGAHWQWYNLAAVHNLLGQREDAHIAIENAIEVRPSAHKYWAFQHYLNIQDVAAKTGLPLKDFLPIPPGGEAPDLQGLFDIDGRRVIEM